MKQIEIIQRTFQFPNDREVYFCTATKCDQALNVQEISYVKLVDGRLPMSWQRSWRTTNRIDDIILDKSSLNGTYEPVSQGVDVLNTIIPDSMDDGMREALSNLNEAVGGDVAGFVCERLQMSRAQLRKSLKAEQVDAVALAIYNIEVRQQGIIIGDQTGIGKGRQAAAIIRYAKIHDILPVFITVKASLFSDIYRDCKALGIHGYKPFIFNAGGVMVDFDIKINEGEDFEEEIAELNKELEFVKDNKERKRIEGEIEKLELQQQCSNYEVKCRDSDKLAKKLIFDKDEYDYVCATYSQFCGEEFEKRTIGGTTNFYPIKVVPKKELLRRICKENKTIFILDEAHNASNNTSKTGLFFDMLLENGDKPTFSIVWGNSKPDNEGRMPVAESGLSMTLPPYQVKGAVYLSATFAKRPDNIWLYAKRTAIKETELNSDELSKVLVNGGFPLQEVVSENLVRSGQMVRRERSFENIEVRYMKLDNTSSQWGIPDTSIEDRLKSDVVAKAVRKIVKWEADNLQEVVRALQVHMLRKGEIVYDVDEGKMMGSLSCSPVFSRLFNFIDQMQLCIKSEVIARRAIQHVKEGKKVVIAISKTGETAISDMTDDYGTTVDELLKTRDEVSVNGDYGALMTTLLTGSLSFYGQDSHGNTVKYRYNSGQDLMRLASEIEAEGFHESIPEEETETILSSLRNAARRFDDCMEELNQTQFDLPISPIDRIRILIENEGIKVAECTGRKKRVEYSVSDVKKSHFAKAKVVRKKKSNTAKLYNDFQNNRVDVMILNSSGATGQSAHAVPTNEVPASEVKQRVMIVAQAELDVAVEIQKRGRINRTGQILNPIYEYISTSIPAEERVMMMLKNKLKSLDSNTSSNQRANDAQLESNDIQNKYGDIVVSQWISRNTDVNEILQIKELDERYNKDKESPISGFARKAMGRLSILDCDEQERFFREVLDDYDQLIEQLKAEDEYDLETEEVDYRAKLIQRDVIRPANSGGTGSVFGAAAYDCVYQCEMKARPLDFNSILELVKKNDFDVKDWYQETKKYTDEEIAKKIKRIDKQFVQKDKETREDFEIRVSGAKDAAIAKLRRPLQNYYRAIENFKVGRVYRNFPPLDSEERDVMAVCLGFSLKSKKGNIYTPSNLQISFAVAHERKIVTYNFVTNEGAGWQKILHVINDANISGLYRFNIRYEYDEEDNADIENKWREECRKAETGKQIRHIVEGNIIGAFKTAVLRDNGSARVIRFTDEYGAKHLGVQYNKGKGNERQTKVMPLKAAVARKYCRASNTFIATSPKYGSFNLTAARKLDLYTVYTKPSDPFGKFAQTKALWEYLPHSVDFINDKKNVKCSFKWDTEEDEAFWQMLTALDFSVEIPTTYLSEELINSLENSDRRMKWPKIHWDVNNIPDENNTPDTSREVSNGGGLSLKLKLLALEDEDTIALMQLQIQPTNKIKRRGKQQAVAGFVDIFVDNPRAQRVRDFIDEARQRGKQIVNVVLHRGHYDLYCDNYVRWNSIYSTPIDNADPEIIYSIINK